MYTTPEVAFDELTGRDGSIGLIVLKRIKSLNALSLVMLNAISYQLTEWENASHVKAVIVRAAEGRAFSAGGDIRFVYERRLAEDPALPDFFRDEYRLNHKIHNFRKPYIALLDGITMGGGVGISVHGSHRVATDHLILAMPETSIGFYPDVGMTYVLSRLSFNMGRYIGLTGARLSRADCTALGLVNAAVNRDVFPELIYTLSDTPLDEDPRGTITAILDEFSEPVGPSLLWDRREEIDACFAYKTIEEIIKALQHGSDWCRKIAITLSEKSPLSLKLTLQALIKAANMDFDECIEMEYNLTHHILEKSDFFEGIRVTVIDRGQKPHWDPPTLKEVTPKMIAGYFEQTEVLLQGADR